MLITVTSRSYQVIPAAWSFLSNSLSTWTLRVWQTGMTLAPYQQRILADRTRTDSGTIVSCEQSQSSKYKFW